MPATAINKTFVCRWELVANKKITVIAEFFKIYHSIRIRLKIIITINNNTHTLYYKKIPYLARIESSNVEKRKIILQNNNNAKQLSVKIPIKKYKSVNL